MRFFMRFKILSPSLWGRRDAVTPLNRITRRITGYDSNDSCFKIRQTFLCQYRWWAEQREPWLHLHTHQPSGPDGAEPIVLNSWWAALWRSASSLYPVQHPSGFAFWLLSMVPQKVFYQIALRRVERPKKWKTRRTDFDGGRTTDNKKVIKRPQCFLKMSVPRIQVF